MKTAQLYLAFAMITSFSFAQTTQPVGGSSAISPAMQDGAALVIHGRKEEIYDNSQYLPSDEWRVGYFVQANGQRFKMAQMRYDTYMGRIEYKEENNLYFPKERVVEFGFENGDVFQNQFYAIKDHNEDTFFQVLYDGKTRLLKHTETTMSNVTPYYSATKIMHFNYHITYYVLNQRGEFEKSKKPNEILLRPLGNKSDSIAAFIKNNHLKIKDIDTLKKVLAHYDSL